MNNSSLPNPLLPIGVARILAGAWFIANGVGTLRQFRDLQPQAQRLFTGDMGATDAPIRATLMLVLAPLLVVIGIVFVVKGFRLTRRIVVRADGPNAIDREDVVAALRDRTLLAYADGPINPHWLLRAVLANELDEMTWWNRELMSRGVRTFLRTCFVAIAIGTLCFALPYATPNDLLGPFPTTFVIVAPVATLLWAALGLMLIQSHGPRVESLEFPTGRTDGAEFIESHPGMLHRESPALGLTLGIVGVAVQCLVFSWWNLSTISYPLLATSIIRHAASIGAGLFFVVVGGRMIAMSAELLLVFRYESLLVLFEKTEQRNVARTAAVRSLSRGIAGPRHLMAAVAASGVRESAEALIRTNGAR